MTPYIESLNSLNIIFQNSKFKVYFTLLYILRVKMPVHRVILLFYVRSFFLHPYGDFTLIFNKE